jgi:hypothetical protein
MDCHMTSVTVPERQYARTNDVITTEVGGEPILLHTGNWIYIEFDNIGGRIWTLLERPQTLSSLVEALTLEFAVDEATCRRDTECFIQDMAQQGFVVESGPALPGTDPK